MNNFFRSFFHLSISLLSFITFLSFVVTFNGVPPQLNSYEIKILPREAVATLVSNTNVCV